MVVGSSVDPKVTDHVRQEVLGKKVLVTLDSLHTRDHVLKEIEIYSKLVTPESYLVVQDTGINGNPVYSSFGPGPHEAVQEFLQTHDNFVVDRSREKFLLDVLSRRVAEAGQVTCRARMSPEADHDRRMGSTTHTSTWAEGARRARDELDYTPAAKAGFPWFRFLTGAEKSLFDESWKMPDIGRSGGPLASSVQDV